MEMMYYVCVDGDSIGSKVGQAILDNNEKEIANVSERINKGLEIIKDFVESMGGRVISYGGDELVGKLPHINHIEEVFKELGWHISNQQGFTITVGIGRSLSEAGKALIAGKLTGKNKVVHYNDEVEDIIHQAHEHALGPDATEEERKENEHYLNHLMGDSDDEIHGDDHKEIEKIRSRQSLKDSKDEDAIIPDEDLIEEHYRNMGWTRNAIQKDDDQEHLASPKELEQKLHEEERRDIGSSTPYEQTEEQEEGDERDSRGPAEDEYAAMLGMALDEKIDDNLKTQIATVLKQFKEKKETLEKLKTQDPNLYRSMIGMLQVMIAMARKMYGERDVRQQSAAGGLLEKK